MLTRRTRLALMAFGLVMVVGGLYGVANGRLKWNREKTLEGSHARLAGAGVAVCGLAMLAFGLLVPDPIWEHF